MTRVPGVVVTDSANGRSPSAWTSATIFACEETSRAWLAEQRA